MTNKELGSVLKQIAVYQELAGENPFKSRAFERAGRIVEQHPESFTTLVEEDRLSGIQGIGKGIGDVLRELVATGKSTVGGEVQHRYSGTLDTGGAAVGAGIVDYDDLEMPVVASA